MIILHQKRGLSLQISTVIQQWLKPPGRLYPGEGTETLLLSQTRKAPETLSLLSNSQLSPVQEQNKMLTLLPTMPALPKH